MGSLWWCSVGAFCFSESGNTFGDFVLVSDYDVSPLRSFSDQMRIFEEAASSALSNSRLDAKAGDGQVEEKPDSCGKAA